MPINPNITLQVQPVQIENPLNNLAKFAALQQAQEQQQMNALKMQEYQRSVDEQNQLRQYLAGGMPDKEEGLLRYGAAGRGVYESLLKGKKESREASKLETEEIAKRLDIRQAQLQNVRTPDQYRMWVQGNFADPVLSRYWSAVGANPAQVQEQVEAMLAQPNGLAMAVQESKDAYAPLREGLVAQAKYPWHAPTPVTMGTGEEGAQQPAVMQTRVDPATGKPGYDIQPVGPVKRTAAPKTEVNVGVKLPEQEKAFETELGKEQAKSVVESRKGAEDAAEIIRTVQQGRKILNSGVITGAGADFLVSLNQGLKQAGLDFGYADASANSQAFAANMAQSVGKFIKQFGAGTGLSDADREYAKEMAAGKISLDRKAIERILSLNEKASRNIIQMHNKKSAGIKTNIPLTVEMPADEAAIPDAPPPGAVRLKGK